MFIATVDTFMNKSGDFMNKTSKINLVIALNAFKGPERSDITFSFRAVTKHFHGLTGKTHFKYIQY